MNTSQAVLDEIVMRAAQARNFVNVIDAPTLHARLNQLADTLERAGQEIITLRGSMYDETEGISAQTPENAPKEDVERSGKLERQVDEAAMLLKKIIAYPKSRDKTIEQARQWIAEQGLASPLRASEDSCN